MDARRRPPACRFFECAVLRWASAGFLTLRSAGVCQHPSMLPWAGLFGGRDTDRSTELCRPSRSTAHIELTCCGPRAKTRAVQARGGASSRARAWTGLLRQCALRGILAYALHKRSKWAGRSRPGRASRLTDRPGQSDTPRSRPGSCSANRLAASDDQAHHRSGGFKCIIMSSDIRAMVSRRQPSHQSYGHQAIRRRPMNRRRSKVRKAPGTTGRLGTTS